MTGASIETTLEFRATSLRDVKARMRGLFTQERVAASGGVFLDGLLDDERRKTGWMRAEAAGDPALRKAYVALFASEVAVDQESIRISGSSQLLERAIGRTEPATMGMVPIFDRNWCGTQSEANQSGGSRGARSQFSLIFADPPAFFALTVGLSARRFTESP